MPGFPEIVIVIAVVTATVSIAVSPPRRRTE